MSADERGRDYTHQVWKFPIPMQDHFALEMPREARILSCATQDGAPFLWAVVDPEKPRRAHRFDLVGTGQPVPHADAPYVGSFQLFGGNLVFHLFVHWPPS